MARVLEVIDDRLAGWLLEQHVFFVGTAPLDGEGHVNVSPKGIAGSFAVLGPRSVAYLDRTGSGVETIAHLRENGRIVVMFCAFDGPPKIVRLHGRGEVAVPGDAGFDELAARFPSAGAPGIRSVITVAVDRISDSCGFGVPEMEYRADRDALDRWAGGKSEAALDTYRRDKNATSIDGLPGIRA
jgi:hypothetical protein